MLLNTITTAIVLLFISYLAVLYGKENTDQLQFAIDWIMTDSPSLKTSNTKIIPKIKPLFNPPPPPPDAGMGFLTASTIDANCESSLKFCVYTFL